MAEKNKKRKAPRQSWRPHWIPSGLYKLWIAAWSVLKIALCALVTVLMICVVCVFVFVGLLGTYLEEDILPNAQIVKESYDLDETSYIHYVDSNGNIQQLQEIYTTTLVVDSADRAARMKENFYDRPEVIYRGVHALLAGNMNFLLD